MSRDPRITSKIMSKIRSTNTKSELALARELRKIGLKFKKHYPIEGKPDFAFPKEKVAVFCDGDFWHGNSWRIRGYSKFGEDIKSKREFWIPKLRNNINRDRHVNRALRNQGWRILRFWESEIKINVHRCAKKVKNIVALRKSD